MVNDSAEEHEIRPEPEQLPGLLFVPVPESKQGKNRPHIDVRADDQGAELAWILAMGATRADVGQGQESFAVLADPDGTEFCVQ